MNLQKELEPVSNNNGITLNELVDTLSQLAGQESDPEVELLELSAGDVLFEQGDEGDRAYLLIAGVLGVRVRQSDGTEAEIDKLPPGAIVGELALLSGEKRSATVYAVNDAGLISLSKSKFKQLTADDPGFLIDEDTTVERTQRLQLTKILVSLIGEVDISTLHALQDQFEWQHLSKGELLFEQGNNADGLYILLEGQLQVTTEPPIGERQFVSEITPGDTVGEYAMLTGEVRTANVSAARESDVVRIQPEIFNRLASDYPQLKARLAHIIIERQQRALIRTRL